jgi:hypothetical protein
VRINQIQQAKNILEGKLMHHSRRPKLGSPPNKISQNAQPVDSERTRRKRDRIALLMIFPSVVEEAEPATAAAVAGVVGLMPAAVPNMTAAVVLTHVSGATIPSDPEVIPGRVVDSFADADLEPHHSTSPPSSRTSGPNLVST